MRLPRQYSTSTRDTAESILLAVCKRHGLRRNQVVSPSRYPDIVRARHEAMYLIATHTNLSSTEIGAMLHRDHATVLYAMRSVTQWRERSEDYAADLDSILNPVASAPESAGEAA